MNLTFEESFYIKYIPLMKSVQPYIMYNNHCWFYAGKTLFLAVFRIRIRSDPYHLAGSGSGSASGNVDLDPGTKKNRDKLAYKSTKIIKIYFFFFLNH